MGKADAEARKLIRGVRRRNPTCRLLVTGCYAELEPGAIRSIAGVDVVFGNRDKSQLPRILDRLGIDARPAGERARVTELMQYPSDQLGDRGCDAALVLPPALHFGDRSRAFLKVQEGCRLSCSYCVIPRVRGASTSVAEDDVIAAAQSLFASGYREIVFTGVNVGDYGRDLKPRTSLAALLRKLLTLCGENRIRLNSLEPRTVTGEIIRLMKSEPRLA